MHNNLEKILAVNQTVQVTVWDPRRDKVEYTFVSKVISVKYPSFVIEPPSLSDSYKITPLLQKGHVVGIFLEANPNPCIFYPVITREPTSGENGYKLQIPNDTKIEVIQRRRHVRIRMCIPIKIQYPLGQHLHSITGHTIDISGGGVRFTSPKLFMKNLRIFLVFRFHENTPLLNLKARIVAITEQDIAKQTQERFVTSCQFLDLDEVQETMIVRECFRRELDL